MIVEFNEAEAIFTLFSTFSQIRHEESRIKLVIGSLPTLAAEDHP